jgi:hypothetical protein
MGGWVVRGSWRLEQLRFPGSIERYDEFAHLALWLLAKCEPVGQGSPECKGHVRALLEIFLGVVMMCDLISTCATRSENLVAHLRSLIHPPHIQIAENKCILNCCNCSDRSEGIALNQTCDPLNFCY